MSDTVEQIKSRLEVADVVSGYLKLQKSGINFKARCPFHNEKSPSFYVSPERKIWHCFGCAKGGDMFTFVQEIEGVEFPEAMRILARRAGVDIEKYSGPKTDNRAPLHEICEISAKFFEKQLWESPSGKRAMAYLTDRGLTQETIKEFRMGYAPNDWQALSGFLRQRGFKERDIVAAGVVVEKEGRAYDRFRSRITFPIEDVNGQVVGFTARIFAVPSKASTKEGDGGASFAKATEGQAKYINTP
ncbi:MAG: CHC2 zinc finger domain-containing protein, partial [Patescibacteria group bacterium]